MAPLPMERPATDEPVRQTMHPTADHSRYVQRVRRRYGDALSLLGPGVPDAASIRALIEHLRTDGHPLGAAMRMTRQLVMERLVVRDVETQAPLDDVVLPMTALAEVTLEMALAEAQRVADAEFGEPLDENGQRVQMWIVGMGKLGARELNVSSDIDLVYLYEDAGQTAGPKVVSVHEYCTAIARQLQTLIGDVTEDGFVFRMDLALRPNGNSGPPVVSLAMLEEYFLVQGREWERFAWLKSRVVAPRDAVDSGRALALRALVTPFVYRKYLDYGVFEGLRQLHHKIRSEAQRRAAGRPQRANDVKLSRGGIREIEFIVQLLLVARGGQFPEIRTRSTLKALARLAAAGLIAPATADKLAQAYTLLRRIEHRIQYLDDQQTHLLPTDDGDLTWIARSLGDCTDSPDFALEDDRDACALLDKLGEVRELVATEFDALLHEGRSPGAPQAARAGGGCRTCGPGTGPLPIDSDLLCERLSPALQDRVRRFGDNPKVAALRDESRLRLGRLVMRTQNAISSGECTEEAAGHFIDWLEPLLRRESYLALLLERPEVHRRLLNLIGLARWPKQYLMRHPGVIDELADDRQLENRFDRNVFIADLDERHAAWERAGEADEGQLLDTLRHAHHAEVFRIIVRDVERRITVEQVADDLSALADAVLDCALRWAWGHLKQRHRDTPQLAVIAYGKLGGKELGYGSDLDLVFLYDDTGEADPDDAQQIYGAFVRKLISWLTLTTAAGALFDIDTALRPNGNSGLLVSSIASFDRYQRGRGGNAAWTWEHQAITRARCCAGPAPLAQAFEATRRAVLTAGRDLDALRAEIVAMREKVLAGHPVRDGRFDVKHSRGGMMDAEFAVQYLVLSGAAAHPSLQDNVGNIALLRRAEEAGLVPAGVGVAAADAYRELRRVQHRARLDGQSTQVAPDRVDHPRHAIEALWRAVFGD